ncbi:MAG: DsbA family protein [Tabrizicola sp.]|nr:DsbA family protein [Tabrizicola sp.]
MKHLMKSAALGLALAIGALTPALAQETGAAAAVEPGDFSLGDPNAPVKIVEYASYTCPHCADFHASNFKPLKADFIDTGKVHFTLREVYFDRYGLWAAMLARCGGEMRYFAIHDVLFSKQREWAGSDDPNVVVGNLKTIGLAAGMDGAVIDACMKDGATAEALITRFETNMEADGVEGTPTIFVNGTKYGNMAYADLKSIIEGELAE